jgi:hypothetical protein
MNVPAATMPLKIINGKIGDPYAIKSPLGWIVYMGYQEDKRNQFRSTTVGQTV